MTESKKGTFFRVCGLFKRKTKDGQTFLSGALGSINLLVMPNKFKAEDKHPDYFLYIAHRRQSKPDAEGQREPGDESQY